MEAEHSYERCLQINKAARHPLLHDTVILMKHYGLQQQQQQNLSVPSHCRYSCPKLFTQHGSAIQRSSPPYPV